MVATMMALDWQFAVDWKIAKLYMMNVDIVDKVSLCVL